jgi:hypothetical protein
MERKMSDKSAIVDFFKKVSLKTKIFFSIIFSVIIFFLAVILRMKMSHKKMLEYELSKVRHNIELERLKKEEDVNLEKIKVLEEEENNILKKIKEIEKAELSKDVTSDELDDFFDSRGF